MRIRSRPAALRCPYCLDSVDAGWRCDRCDGVLHTACAEAHGGCAVCDPRGALAATSGGGRPGRLARLEAAWRERRASTRRRALGALVPAATLALVAVGLPHTFTPYPSVVSLLLILTGVLCLMGVAVALALVAVAYAGQREARGALRLAVELETKPTNATAPLREGG